MTSSSDKKLQETIRFVENLKAQWMETVDSIQDPLMIIQSDYSIDKANLALARFADLPIKEIVGKKCYEIFAKRSSPCKGCGFQPNTDAKQEFEIEQSERRKYFEVHSAPLQTTVKKGLYFVNVYRDRTKEKMLQGQVLKNEKLASIGLLAGGVAHEINNPLGGVLVFSQMILKEMQQTNEHYQDVVEIEAAAQRCKTIVNDLLKFARSNEQTLKRQESLFDVNDCMAKAIKYVDMASDSHKVEVIVEPSTPDDVKLSGVENEFIQLIMNLIQNAYHASVEHGKVKISTKTKNKQLLISIQDSGKGISRENLTKIFDPFFTTKEPGEGTGLGLSVCHTIVHNMRGDISVDSTENLGTTFTMTFPLPSAP